MMERTQKQQKEVAGLLVVGFQLNILEVGLQLKFMIKFFIIVDSA